MKEEVRDAEFSVFSCVETEHFNNKKIFYKRLARASLLLIIAFFLFQFGVILIKNFNEDLQKKMHKWNASNNEHVDLFGIQNKIKNKPEWTFKGFFLGENQKQFELWFNTRLIPLRSKLIKLHNQVYYSVFSKSYMLSNGAVVGKDGYLYHFGSMVNYYNLGRLTYSQETLDQWADDILALANFFHRRGQTFIYMITPSKPSYQPEYLPTCRRCKVDQTRPAYVGLTQTLKKRGFQFVDGSEITLNAKKDFGPHMFPKGGLHWTPLAAAFSTRELMRQMSEKYPLPELTFSYRLDAKPRPIDMDMAAILNVFKTPKHYEVPEVFIKPLPRKYKKPLKVAIISGSFLFETSKILAETQLFDQIDFFFYWQGDHYRHTPGTKSDAGTLVETAMPFKALGINPDDPKAYDDIKSADFVILEENETNIPAEHRRALIKKFLGKKVSY